MRTKPLSTAVRERLALWYLREGKSHVTLEQLVNMADSMEGPCIVSKNLYKDHASLKAFIGKQIHLKYHPPAAPDVSVGS